MLIKVGEMDVTSIHAHEAVTIVIHSIARRGSPVVRSLSLASLIQGHVMQRGRTFLHACVISHANIFVGLELVAAGHTVRACRTVTSSRVMGA